MYNPHSYFLCLSPYGSIAQSVEQETENLRVGGSIPPRATTITFLSFSFVFKKSFINPCCTSFYNVFCFKKTYYFTIFVQDYSYFYKKYKTKSPNAPCLSFFFAVLLCFKILRFYKLCDFCLRASCVLREDCC